MRRARVASHPRAGELTALPCLTVGERSADAARAAGFSARRVGGRCARRSGAACDAASRNAASSIWRARIARAISRANWRATASRSKRPWSIARFRSTNFPPEIAQARLDGVLHYSRRSAATLLRLAGAAGALNTLLGLAALLSVRGGRGPAAGGGRAADRGRRIADRICVIDVVEVTLSRYADPRRRQMADDKRDALDRAANAAGRRRST